MQCLLRHGAVLDARDHYGKTALHVAAIDASYAIMNALLRHPGYIHHSLINAIDK
jgi:ankyrin repeat protein